MFEWKALQKVTLIALNHVADKHTTCAQRWNDVETVASTCNIRDVLVGFLLDSP